ncbi:hypothetical protein THAOC_29276 [Thalassiosira oceanica]|uniref:Uncharacterized protein n=1 Tax=Thalassiosira oceanica TaxID=159749 RepID=K0RCW2_THAOC|nr:hypothetical protein THAOC_29276 [Thalassiosira oceanica]|eukprot:EJK51543.1 hypothetical protein THAOC_29276 [Thalassiosira oceanica]
MDVAEGCIPEQNRPLVPILASAEAVAPAITDDFGLEVERRSTPHNYTAIRTPPVTERQRSAHGDITGFEIRRFSNGDPHAADSQANYKYVQMDVGTLTDSLSPNIHRSMAIASIIRFACFRLLSDHSLFNRVLPEGLLWQGLWLMQPSRPPAASHSWLRRRRLTPRSLPSTGVADERLSGGGSVVV